MTTLEKLRKLEDLSKSFSNWKTESETKRQQEIVESYRSSFLDLKKELELEGLNDANVIFKNAVNHFNNFNK